MTPDFAWNRGEIMQTRFTQYSQEKKTGLLVIMGKFNYYGNRLDQKLISDNIRTWCAKNFAQEHMEK